VHPAEDFSVGRDIVLPAEAASHYVTCLEVRMTRLQYLPDSKGCHDLANRNLWEVGVAPHPDALRGIDRQPKVSDQHLSLRGLGNGCLVPAELFAGQFTSGASVQNPLTVLAHGLGGRNVVSVHLRCSFVFGIQQGFFRNNMYVRIVSHKRRASSRNSCRSRQLSTLPGYRRRRVRTKSATPAPISIGLSSWTKWMPFTVTSV
jgi:hypothetical protein